jgi:hypothetical protein
VTEEGDGDGGGGGRPGGLKIGCADLEKGERKGRETGEGEDGEEGRERG